MFPEHPHSVAFLLPSTCHERVEAIWQKLQTHLGLAPRFNTPIPHLSLHVAEGYDEARVQERLRDFAAHQPPLQVRTAGLGIFTGPNPVLVLMVVRTAELSAFHQALFADIIGLAQTPSPYYTPENWLPHITLSPAPLAPQTLVQAVSLLSHEPYVWELTLDQLALICDNCGEQGVHYRYFLRPAPASLTPSSIHGGQ